MTGDDGTGNWMREEGDFAAEQADQEQPGLEEHMAQQGQVRSESSQVEAKVDYQSRKDEEKRHNSNLVDILDSLRKDFGLAVNTSAVRRIKESKYRKEMNIETYGIPGFVDNLPPAFRQAYLMLRKAGLLKSGKQVLEEDLKNIQGALKSTEKKLDAKQVELEDRLYEAREHASSLFEKRRSLMENYKSLSEEQIFYSTQREEAEQERVKVSSMAEEQLNEYINCNIVGIDASKLSANRKRSEVRKDINRRILEYQSKENVCERERISSSNRIDAYEADMKQCGENIKTYETNVFEVNNFRANNGIFYIDPELIQTATESIAELEKTGKMMGELKETMEVYRKTIDFYQSTILRRAPAQEMTDSGVKKIDVILSPVEERHSQLREKTQEYLRNRDRQVEMELEGHTQ